MPQYIVTLQVVIEAKDRWAAQDDAARLLITTPNGVGEDFIVIDAAPVEEE